MTQQPDTSFETLLKVVWKRKLFIIFFTLLCAVIAAIISLLLPKTYEAQATLVIIPSRLQAELQLEPFSPITYKNLLENKDMAQQIIAQLQLPDIKIEELLENMNAEVVIEERGLNLRSYSPMVKLNARGPTPELAAQIANTWSDLFVTQNTRLTAHESELSYTFLINQFAETTNVLEESEHRMIELKDRVKLDLLKLELSNRMNRLNHYRVVLIDLKYELDTKTNQLEQLRKIVDAQEIDGQWIGNIRLGMTADDDAVQFTELENESLEPAMQIIRRDVLNIRRNLVDAENQLHNFLDQHKIEMVRRQFEDRNEELVKLKMELARDEVRLTSLEASLKTIQEILIEQDKYIIFRRSISDEALWNRLSGGNLNPADIQQLAGIKLESEELNPVYQNLVRQFTDQQVEFNTLKPKRAELEQKIFVIDSTVRVLDSQLIEYEMKKTRLENQVNIARTNYDFSAKQYAKNKSDLLTVQQEVKQLIPRVAETERTVDILDTSVREIQSRIHEGEILLEQLSRQIATATTTYNLLANEVEKVRIAKANEISDLKIASRAVEPQKRIWPFRTLITMTAFIAGLLLSVIFAFLQEYLFLKL